MYDSQALRLGNLTIHGSYHTTTGTPVVSYDNMAGKSFGRPSLRKLYT